MSCLKSFTRRSTAAMAGLAAVMLFMLNTGSAPAQSGNPQSAAIVADGDVRLGVYDPAGAFGSASSLSLEHIYLPLIRVDLESLQQAGSYAASRNRDLLITVEPWSWDGRWNVANEEIIKQIVEGGHDKEIVSLCRT